MHEAQMHKENSFVTLTYDNEHLPRNGGLQIEDFQRFCRKLRKAKGKFRYFHCGEYGDENDRPHYHAIIFGLDFSEERQLLKRTRNGPLYVAPTLFRAWNKGFHTIGACEYHTAMYVSKYIMKKLTGEEGQKAYVNAKTGEALRPPYISMSRRPGLGSKWLEKYKSDVYPEDVVHLEGKKFRPPRFYDERIGEEELAAMKRKRLSAVAKRKEDLDPARLRDLETIQVKKQEIYKRNL